MPHPLRRLTVEREHELDLGGFSGSIERGLCIPLAALRAALECLESELDVARVDTVAVPGALLVLEQATRMALTLRDLASSPTLHPLRCTLPELASDVRRGLPPRRERQLLIAMPASTAQSFIVDGPLLSRAIRSLVHAALDAGAERVLLSLRLDSAGATFTLLDDACPFRGSSAAAASLQNALAERDLELLGGELSVSHTQAGGRCLHISFAADSHEEASR